MYIMKLMKIFLFVLLLRQSLTSEPRLILNSLGSPDIYGTHSLPASVSKCWDHKHEPQVANEDFFPKKNKILKKI